VTALDAEKLNEVSGAIVDSAVEVHQILGPGLLESAYEQCLVWELEQRELNVDRQVALPVSYKSLRLDNAYRLDIVVANEVIVELKCVDRIEPIHTAQLLTYLRMTGLRLGLILNFKTPVMKNGIKRVVNGL
jgi:GxxExxY protein